MSDATPFRLTPVEFADLPGWAEDDPSALFRVFADIERYLAGGKPYKSGALGLSSEALRGLAQKAASTVPETPAAARAFFEAECRVFRIDRADGRRGFVTGFYEPDVAVSDRRDTVYRYSFYRRPANLLPLDDANRPDRLPASYAFGLSHAGRISAYADRQAIDQGYLDGLGLEIAYARSKLDVFFAHIQGAARLRYPDGSVRRITYDGKSGHPFTAIGRILIDRGCIDAATVSMQSIRGWLEAHPEEADAVLWQNRSYIFFREAPVEDPAQGPVAAAKVPLLAGRSLAIDRTIHTFGYPFFIRAETIRHLGGADGFARLMLGLDTGTAIVGPARGDIFTGSGDAAGEAAGIIRHPADFYLLVPRSLAEGIVHGR